MLQTPDEQLAETLSNETLMKTLGLVRLVEADADVGRVRMEFEAKQEQCHSGNIVQGGFVTGWIDSAMAHAVMVRTNYALIPLSLEIKVAFYRSAHPGILTAEAWIEQMGRKTAFAEGRLLDAEGQVIAKGTSTIKLKAISK